MTARGGLPRLIVIGLAGCCALGGSVAAPPAAAQRLEQNDSASARRRPIDPEAAPRPTARAVLATGPVQLDGRLDDPAWREAEPITGFVQAQPRRGYPASERTVVRVLYDRGHLYIGALCYDSEPGRIIIPSLEQDFETHNSDIFAVTLDTFLDRRNSFMFLINPRGAVKDGQTFNNSRNLNLAWEGVIQVRTEVHDSGWTVEMAIPFTTLRFDASQPEQTWGVQFLRRIRRKNEDAYWAPLDRRDRIHKMARAGTLVGLEGIEAGRNLSVKPYLLATRSRTAVPAAAGGSAGDHVDQAFDGGLDLKYSVTPGLTLDLTYNTDFAQVEVDQEQVNLTRFPLFFPEKRDFFIENSGVFTFGDVSERNYRMGASLRDFTLFHSRRIGLTDGGAPIPIVGGGRLTGRVGEFAVGLLDMQTEASAVGPAENFAVARLRRNLFGRADVGVIFVNRQATGDGAAGYNRSYGADANVRLLDNMIIHSYIAATASSGAVYADPEASDSAASGSLQAGRSDGDRRAARLSVAWRDQVWDASAFIKHVGDAFDPGLGFVRRRGMRQTYATVGAHPQPPLPFVQEINPYVELAYITNLESVLETRSGTLGFDLAFLDGGSLRLSYTDRFERLAAPFPVRSEAVIPAGDYAFREASAVYQSSAGRPISGRLSFTGGDFFHGQRRSYGAGLLWRPRYWLKLELSGERNEITLPGDAFTADVFSARLDWAYSTRLLASALVQYNEAAEEVVTNIRLNLIHAPLSDFFLVYTERRDAGHGEVLRRAFTAKMTRLLAF